MLAVLRSGFSPSRARLLFFVGMGSLFTCLLLCGPAFGQTYEGTLQVAEADGPNGESLGTEYTLETASGTLSVVPSALDEGASSGDKVKVTGSLESGELVGEVAVTSQAEEGTLKVHKVLVLAVRFPGDRPEPFALSLVQERIFTGTQSVNSFYQKESYGQLSFAGKLDPEGDIFGWFEIAPVEGCDSTAIRKEANQAATEAGVSLTGYDHIVYVSTGLPCGWAGLGALGGSWININGLQYNYVYPHEFGHNLGFNHAERLICKDAEGHVVPVSNNCTVEPYGDLFDIMGFAEGWGENCPSRLEHLGIIGSKNVKVIENDGTYEVESHQEPTEGIVSLRIPRFFSASHKLTGYYELEIRKGTVHQEETDGRTTGVTIRRVGLTGTERTYIYYPEEGSAALSQAALQVGHTFNDGSVSITTLSAGKGKATVQVSFAPGAGDTQPPTTPTGLASTVLSEGLEGVHLSWKASEDNVKVARYLVFRDGEEIKSTSQTEFTDTHAAAGTHAYIVYAEDGRGNRSLASEVATANVILPFTIPPTKIASFGSVGSGNGQFTNAFSVAVDPSGNVWVSDKQLNRVQKFNEKGEFLLQLGSKGSGSGQFESPAGIGTTANGDLWVVDQGNRRVEKFNAKGEYLEQFGSSGSKDGQFSNPRDLAIAPDGSIWVSDIGRDDVQKFNASGAFILKSGGNGNGNGQFSDPNGIATDAAGDLWVADSGNHRLQKLSPTGAFLYKVGSEGSGPGQFISLRDVVVRPDGSLLVSGDSRVQQLTPEWRLLSEAGGAYAEGIALGRGGKFFVSDGAGAVNVWSQPVKPEATTEAASGVKRTEATLNGSVNPGGSETTYRFEYGTTTGYGASVPAAAKSAGPGSYAKTVSETLSGLSRDAVYHYRLVAENVEGIAYGEDKTFSTGVPPTHLFSFGSEGSGDGQFSFPSGVAVDSSGNIWVADKNLNRVQKFNEKGEFLLRFGSQGSGPGQFESPRGIAVTANGDVWVVDRNNHRLEKFNAKGEYLEQFGSSGSGDGQFVSPSDVAISPDGSIWVYDEGRFRLQKFTAAGKFILGTASWGYGSGDGQFKGSGGISIDASGNLWIAETGNPRVQELSPTGAFLAKFGTSGSGPGQFASPGEVAVKPDGTLLVADRNNYRLQHLTSSGEPLSEAFYPLAMSIAIGRGGKFFVAGLNENEEPQVAVWWQPAPPEATTEAATDVEPTEATLHATIDASGVETTYRFQWGATTSYGNNAPATPKSLGSGTEPVAVSQTISGLTEEGIYHYRVVAESTEGTTYGKDATFVARGPSRLEQLPVVQSFDGSSSSLEGFAADWSALGWAGGETPKGQDTSAGWGPLAVYPTVNGVFYKPTLTDPGSGIGVAATLKTPPTVNGNYFSLWLDASGGKSTRSGYELRFTRTALYTYEVALSKWVEGSRTVLASKASYGFNAGFSGVLGYIGLVDHGGTVAAWTKLGSSPFAELLSASDSAFASGSAALEGAGNATRINSFKAGVLPSVMPKATTQAASSVKGTEATLNGTVNPRGIETSYWLEWGESTGYGNKVPATPASVGSGHEPVAVSQTISGLLQETVYHYRIVAKSIEGTTYGEDRTLTTPGPIGLNALPVVQSFDGGSSSLEGFAADWSALGWAGGETPKGQDTSTGWGPVAAYPTVNGAFYKPTLTDAGSGAGVAVKVSQQPSTSQSFSLWLDASGTKSARSGYELRVTTVGFLNTTETLSKWVEGSQVVLGTKSTVVNFVGLVDKGATVSAWGRTSESKPYAELVSVADSAFSSGNAGLEGAGNATRLKSFKAGPLG